MSEFRLVTIFRLTSRLLVVPVWIVAEYLFLHSASTVLCELRSAAPAVNSLTHSPWLVPATGFCYRWRWFGGCRRNLTSIWRCSPGPTTTSATASRPSRRLPLGSAGVRTSRSSSGRSTTSLCLTMNCDSFGRAFSVRNIFAKCVEPRKRIRRVKPVQLKCWCCVGGRCRNCEGVEGRIQCMRPVVIFHKCTQFRTHFPFPFPLLYPLPSPFFLLEVGQWNPANGF